MNISYIDWDNTLLFNDNVHVLVERLSYFYGKAIIHGKYLIYLISIRPDWKQMKLKRNEKNEKNGNIAAIKCKKTSEELITQSRVCVKLTMHSGFLKLLLAKKLVSLVLLR